MIPAAAFAGCLRERGFTFFTGVPCSFFRAAIDYVSRDRSLLYIAAANEGAAVGLAAGACLAGRKPVVMVQNSGLGNMVNPLASLSLVYRVPALLLISGRAYPDPEQDEPQHRVMGHSMRAILDALGIGNEELPDTVDAFTAAIDRVVEGWHARSVPVAFIVKKGTVAPADGGERPPAVFPLRRIDAIRTAAETLAGGEAVVATTGMISRELLAVAPALPAFHMEGSMGHAMAIAAGVALSRPGRRVVVFDGDGAVIMHMGSLSTIGHYAPPNLVHVVFDNEAYETTGGQLATSVTTRLDAVAAACGYRHVARCGDAHEITRTMADALKREGPSLVLVKVNTTPAEGIPRVTRTHAPEDTARRFRTFVTTHP